MTNSTTLNEIEYPESDGRPMGETDLHIHWMIRIREILKHRYRDQRVYVGSNLLVYYEEGQPTRFIVPDGFVVLDCDPEFRRVYKIWEEGKSPDVVFEVTSRSTSTEDEVYKAQRYEQMGVGEYFLYDPSSDYLDPALQGFRLVDGVLTMIEAREGRLSSDVLGIDLTLENGELVMFDGASKSRLLTGEEAARAEKELAQQRAEQAESRLRAALEEIERLRRPSDGS